MMRFSHRVLIVFSALLWAGIGLFLLIKGLALIDTALHVPALAGKGMEWVASQVGGREQGALLLISTALLVGFLKGRFVLRKTVERVVGRIRSFPEPVAASQVYSGKYYAVIGFMVALGMVFKWIPWGIECRGWVDTAIGSALLNGAILYLRALIQTKGSSTHV